MSAHPEGYQTVTSRAPRWVAVRGHPANTSTADLLAEGATISHPEPMSVAAPPATTYRYLCDSQPKCGIVGQIVDVHATSRQAADLMILAVEERFYGGHAKQDDVTFEWSISDGHGFPLISATTTPDGTTYHPQP